MPPYLYISSGIDDALVIVDAAPAGIPDLVGVLRDPLIDVPCEASVYGDYAYIPCQTPNRLVIANISNPAAPFVVSSIEGAGFPNYLGGITNAHVRNNGYCYVISQTDDSLSIIDVSNPLAPVLAGVIRGAGAPPGGNYLNQPNSIFVDDNLIAYVAAALDNSLTIIDVSNPAAPVLLGNIAGAGAPNFLSSIRKVVVRGIYAYTVAFVDQRLCIFNVSNPALPTFEGSITHTVIDEPWSLDVLGNYAYTVSQVVGDGLGIFNIANPAAPAYVGGLVDWAHIGGCRGLIAPQSTFPRVYVLGSNAAVDSVCRINVANPAAPVFQTWLQGGGPPNYLNSPEYISQNQAFLPIVQTNPATEVT